VHPNEGEGSQIRRQRDSSASTFAEAPADKSDALGFRMTPEIKENYLPKACDCARIKS
jgi:hypothetical protein